MKKGLSVILVLLLIGALGVFTDAGRQAAAAGGKTIKVGVNSENPPWIFAKDGKMTGFEADLIEAFAKRAGYEIDYKSAPFATVLTGVQSGQWEVAMSSIWIKKERAEVMDFADPYYDSGIGMMTRKERRNHRFEPDEGKGLRLRHRFRQRSLAVRGPGQIWPLQDQELRLLG
jgi:ABC-type amino acid transport substrate-binding protein